jgi:hypothetical protein
MKKIVDFLLFYASSYREPTMKYFKLLLITGVFTNLQASAQFKLPVDNAFRNGIQKVVADYPSQFVNIKGEVLNKNPQSVEFASTEGPASALESVVIEYSSGNRMVMSWQALLLSTEDFEEAEKKYHWTFTQLKGMNIPYVIDQYTLQGKYNKPDESLKFVTSTLAPQFPPQAYKKLKVEVSMRYEFPEWKVFVAIFDKEREDHERGEVHEIQE